MADYSKLTNFASKDALLSGDPLKVIKGTEIDDEFEALETTIATKADLASPTFTGTPKAPTAAQGTSTTQIATTAFVDNAVNNLPANSVCSTQIGNNCVTADELNVTGDGTAGQVLISDADGSFSWYTLPGASSNPFLSPSATDPTTRDDGSALQEGDIYYNTADDELRSYDGSVWSTTSADYAAGATGTTSIPPVGALVLGNIQAPTWTGSNYYIDGGYGDTFTCTGSLTIYTHYKVYDYYNVTSGRDGDHWGGSITINSGTWQLLGGAPEYSNNGLDRTAIGLFTRIA